VLEHAGYQVTVRPNLGAREIVEPALEKGEIDVLAEYAGTALEFLNKGAGEATSDADATVAKLRERFASLGVSVLDPAPAVDGNALVVTKATADAKKLAKISDLVAIGNSLSLGGPAECPKRPFCMLGFQKTYGLKFKTFKPLDAGGPITVAALEKGDIDVALLFSSDGAIAAKGFVVLDDDKHLQPADNLVPIVRTKVLDPDITRLLNDVSAKLTTAELSKLNKQVGIDKQDPAAAAEGWLKEQQLL
jgi:osmoprotectant transport system substrate-binding protein